MQDKTDLADRIDFIGLNPAQRQTLAQLRPLVAKVIGPTLDEFYRKASKHPHTASFFRSADHIAHAKNRQVMHWDQIAKADYGQDYVDAVSAVGKTHARLGLEPRWYIGGYSLIIEGIVRALIANELKGPFVGKKSSLLADQISALVKAAMLDMDYAISVYLDVLARERAELETARQQSTDEQNLALNALDMAVDGLANRDLTVKINQVLAPAFEKLKNNFNRSAHELDDALCEVAAAVAQVQSEVHSISVSADDMAKRTEQQASALEQTSAALEQINSNSTAAAQRTREVQAIVEESARETIESGDVVKQAVDAMGAIETSSSKMTQIIGAIDEIAFQTNLLALNAGVEAARAGEQGKGFAVVAQEVRELAQRSSAAAKQIKELIDQSSADVNRGVQLVNRTGDALSKLGERVSTINDHISWIAKSAREQASGIDEINAAMRSMDQITQKNAAHMEETNASTQTLAQVSAKLADLLSQFRTSSSVKYGASQMRRRA